MAIFQATGVAVSAANPEDSVSIARAESMSKAMQLELEKAAAEGVNDQTELALRLTEAAKGI